MSDLQVVLTTNDVFLSLIADVKTATGVQIITRCPAAMAQSLPLLAFAHTADATSWELLLRWNPFFRRIHGNWFQTRFRQLLGLIEANQTPEFRGTHYFKLVLEPISQLLPPQLRSPWTEWHKKDGAGQWAIVLDMPPRPLNTPHVEPDVLHQIYPYVLCWVTDLVAIPQQKFSVGSTADDKIPKVLAQEAPRVLEASTLLLRGEEVVGEVMDLASPPWAPASILALHLASGLRDPLSMCSPQELLRTPRVPEVSLAVWTAAGGVEAPTELGGFLVDDACSPPPARLVDGDSVPFDQLSQFEAAIRLGAPRKEDAQPCQFLGSSSSDLRAPIGDQGCVALSVSRLGAPKEST